MYLRFGVCAIWYSTGGMYSVYSSWNVRDVFVLRTWCAFCEELKFYCNAIGCMAFVNGAFQRIYVCFGVGALE